MPSQSDGKWGGGLSRLNFLHEWAHHLLQLSPLPHAQLIFKNTTFISFQETAIPFTLSREIFSAVAYVFWKSRDDSRMSFAPLCRRPSLAEHSPPGLPGHPHLRRLLLRCHTGVLWKCVHKVDEGNKGTRTPHCLRHFDWSTGWP